MTVMIDFLIAWKSHPEYKSWKTRKTPSHDHDLSSEFGTKVCFLLPVSLKRSRLTVRCRTILDQSSRSACFGKLRSYLRWWLPTLSTCMQPYEPRRTLPRPPRLVDFLNPCWLDIGSNLLLCHLEQKITHRPTERTSSGESMLSGWSRSHCLQLLVQGKYGKRNSQRAYSTFRKRLQGRFLDHPWKCYKQSPDDKSPIPIFRRLFQTISTGW